jgi:oxygen-independent coproporphyrinogen-3 oxidase
VTTNRRFGLYVHVPFCPQRCPYCAFTVVTGRQDTVDAYVDAVCREIESQAHRVRPGGLSTVFLGGGTPSRLAPAQLERLLAVAQRVFGLAADAEITVEANPTTAEAGRFADFRAAGVTRLSLGVQSLCDATLRCLGRMHDAAEATEAYRIARGAGFASVSIDLIFSVPGAPAGDWSSTLSQAMELAPDHLSAYALSVEEGTPRARRRAAGDLVAVDEEADAADYEHLVSTLNGAGYEHYEISNFARQGHRSRHNWDCWTGADYLGVGVSAHSYVDGERWWNTKDLDDYLRRVAAGVSPRDGGERLQEDAARAEALWLALRTCEGAELTEDEANRLRQGDLWRRLCAAGHARLAGTTLKLTEAGFAVADAVAVAVADEVLARQVAA